MNEVTRADDDLTAFPRKERQRRRSARSGRLGGGLGRGRKAHTPRIAGRRAECLTSAQPRTASPRRRSTFSPTRRSSASCTALAVRGVVSEEHEHPIDLDAEGRLLVAHRPARRFLQYRRQRHDRDGLLRPRRAAGSARRGSFSPARNGPARGRDFRLRPSCGVRFYGRPRRCDRDSRSGNGNLSNCHAPRKYSVRIQRVRDQLRELPALAGADPGLCRRICSKGRTDRANATSTCAGSAQWSPTSTGS